VRDSSSCFLVVLPPPSIPVPAPLPILDTRAPGGHHPPAALPVVPAIVVAVVAEVSVSPNASCFFGKETGVGIGIFIKLSHDVGAFTVSTNSLNFLLKRTRKTPAEVFVGKRYRPFCVQMSHPFAISPTGLAIERINGNHSVFQYVFWIFHKRGAQCVSTRERRSPTPVGVSCHDPECRTVRGERPTAGR